MELKGGSDKSVSEYSVNMFCNVHIFGVGDDISDLTEVKSQNFFFFFLQVVGGMVRRWEQGWLSVLMM